MPNVVLLGTAGLSRADVEMLDTAQLNISGSGGAEVEVIVNATSVWINIGPICVFRLNRINSPLSVTDYRVETDDKD